jgi:diaminopimelate decarboxylase
VAEAGLTLYRIAAIKETPGGRVYAAVDGGMGDNIRPALYQAEYGADVDAKPTGAPTRRITVAGRYCESGDILIDEAVLADPHVGDLLAIWGTGAYNFSMASQYNRVPRPAVVAVSGGESQLWVDRETWEDVGRLDRTLRGWPDAAK